MIVGVRPASYDAELLRTCLPFTTPQWSHAYAHDFDALSFQDRQLPRLGIDVVN